MYCENCGKELGFNETVCGRCGNRIGGETIFIQQHGEFQGSSSSIVYNMPAKNPGYAAIFSFLITGLGQIYAGKIARGFILMLACVSFGSLGGFFAATWLEDHTGLTEIEMVLMFACIIAAIAVWVWNVADAYKCANIYNDGLIKNGKRPW